MKKAFLLITLALLIPAYTLLAQEQQLLPLQPLSANDSIVLSAIPELPMNLNATKRSIPAVVDNSALPFMRPLIGQVGLECGQASSIGIQFTYELNAKRQLPGNVPENQYATHFAYNFLNNGSDAGINFFETFEIVKYAGNPNVADYGGMSQGGASRWMSGYDLYYNAMKNRIENVYSIKTHTEEGLLKLKHWIYDHGNGSHYGGMASFYSQFTSPPATLPPGTPEAGKHVITYWGSSPNHAMTIVGYNDSIRWDYNNDGQYTNHIDLNGDGIIDVRDWEIGGFKMANTYGSISGWGDQGFSYMMYKTVAESASSGGIWNHQVVVVDVKETYMPWLTAKVGITYSCRNKLKLMVGVSTDPLTTEPDYVLQFPMFDFQGGCKPMQGNNGNNFIEIGLDLNPLLAYIEPGQNAKFFFMVTENDPGNSDSGTVNSFELIDYTGGSPVSTVSSAANVPIQNNDVTYLTALTAVNFTPVEIVTENMEPFQLYTPVELQLEAEGGSEPYFWYLQSPYDTINSTAMFPVFNGQQLTPSNTSDGTASIELPFEFPFYGETFSTIYAAVDGFLMFEPSLVTWPYYVAGKSYLIQNKIIAPTLSKPFYISSSNGDGIWAEVSSNVVSIRWQLSVYGQSGNSTVSMAARLHENGRIEFFYGTNNAASYVARFAGISAGDGINHIILNKYGTFIPDNQQYTSFMPMQDIHDITLTKSGILGATFDTYTQAQSIQVMVADQNGIRNSRQLELQLEGLIMDFEIMAGNDGLVSYGEEFALNMNLQNINSFALDAGTLSVSTDDPYFTITESQTEIPAIAQGESYETGSVFHISTSNQVPDAHNADFTLQYSNGTKTYSRTISIKAHAPLLHLQNVSINDEGNGILEPGESAFLVVSLLNKGGAALENVEAMIQSDNSDLTILAGQTSTNELGAMQSWDAIFQIYLSDDASPMQIVEIQLDVTASNDFHFEKIMPILTSIIVENFETGNFELYPWVSTGTSPWEITNQQAWEGIYAARSGSIGDNEFSTLELTWDVAITDSISFYLKVSSETNYDFLRFSIDGIEKQNWSGNNDSWIRAQFPVEAGEHAFRWRYDKDFSVSTGSDCAWIDYIILPAKKIYTSIPEKTDAAFQLHVNPNPVWDELRIHVKANKNFNSQLLITDMSGRVYYETQLILQNDISQSLQLNKTQLPQGTFLVMLLTTDGWLVKKLVRLNN